MNGIACLEDMAARERYLKFVDDSMRELMNEYGKIDILWYDGPSPLRNAEEWRSIERNLMIRELQPDILINDRINAGARRKKPDEFFKVIFSPPCE